MTESVDPTLKLLQVLPEPVCIFQGASIVFCNDAFGALVGLEPAVALRATLDQLVTEESLLSLRDTAKVLSEDGGACIEVMVKSKVGEARTCEGTVAGLKHKNQPAALLLLRDVTEQRALQSRLYYSERMAAVGTLATGVSHEINNPLTYILANQQYADDALADLEGKITETSRQFPSPSWMDALGTIDELRRVLAEAQQGAERVKRIVQDLKTFARPDDGRLRETDVREVLESAINMVWAEIRHRARLVKDFQPTPGVMANHTRLGQIFINLLINAAQAIPEGDSRTNVIRVTTATSANGKVLITISDTGCGISSDKLQRIFEPFYTTKPGRGSGLGLSVAYGVVQHLGGTIRVQSELDKGSTFEVELPATSKEEVAPPKAPGKQKGPQILVVDDDAPVAHALRRTLNLRCGAEVTVATSADEALALILAQHQYDVVFCDLLMPDKPGMDLYAEVAEKRPGFEKRFIIMTGSAFTDRARNFLDAIPNARIFKPFDAKSVVQLVEERCTTNLRAL